MSDKSLNIAIAAGGTAGHINPALAMAEELRSRGHNCVFYGQGNRLEATLVPEAGFEFVGLDLCGFDRRRPWTLFSALSKMKKAEKEVASIFAQGRRPDVAIGFGAYIELPLLNVCHSQNIPCLIHEQNSVAGLANKKSAGKCVCACVAFPAAASIFKSTASARTSVVVTGNPVRSSVIEGSRTRGRQEFGVPEDARMLLVFGGSLGARKLNETMAEAKSSLLAREDLYIIHSTGAKQYEEAEGLLKLTDEEKKRYKLLPYISDMGDALAASDLVISRAGASSVAEIAAVGVPSILVPYPLATADHQTTNAHLLSDIDGAYVVKDDELTASVLDDLLSSTLDDKEHLRKMRSNISGLGQDRAASALADQVVKAVELNKLV